MALTVLGVPIFLPLQVFSSPHEAAVTSL